MFIPILSEPTLLPNRTNIGNLPKETFKLLCNLMDTDAFDALGQDTIKYTN